MKNDTRHLKELSLENKTALLSILKQRFEVNMHRHPSLTWQPIEAKLEKNPEKMQSLQEMELTEGEPDVIGYDATTNEYIFCDCSKETPKGRRSFCYDGAALASRKEHKPRHSALEKATEMGLTLLTELEYQELQLLENFDTKTSSWLATPQSVRSLGGALFGDFRFGKTFIYHNGAESYYAARGFRGLLRV